jgi:hypothetical protein
LKNPRKGWICESETLGRFILDERDYLDPQEFRSVLPLFSVGKYLNEKARRSKFGCKAHKDSEKAAAKAERSEVVEVGGSGGSPGGWVLASPRRETEKRHCGAVAERVRCCPEPALRERNTQYIQIIHCKRLYSDSGGVVR